jgi:hypothetical protein
MTQSRYNYLENTIPNRQLLRLLNEAVFGLLLRNLISFINF